MSGITTISEQIRNVRKRKGLSLSTVARRAGTSPATLSRYESGWARFELYTLQKLASALGCEIRIEFIPRGDTLPAGGNGDSGRCLRRVRRLFWDHKLTREDIKGHPPWVVERILEYGQLDDIRAFRECLGREQFIASVARANRLSPRAREFWKQVLALEGKPCTKKHCRNTVWNY